MILIVKEVSLAFCAQLQGLRGESQFTINMLKVKIIMIWTPEELPVDSKRRAEDDANHPEEREKLHAGFC